MVFIVAYGCYPSLLLLGDLERPVQGVQEAGHDVVVILGDLRLRVESLDMLRALLLADLHLAKGVKLLVALHGHFDVSSPAPPGTQSRCSESTSPSARTSALLYAHPYRTSSDTATCAPRRSGPQVVTRSIIQMYIKGTNV